MGNAVKAALRENAKTRGVDLSPEDLQFVDSVCDDYMNLTPKVTAKDGNIRGASHADWVEWLYNKQLLEKLNSLTTPSNTCLKYVLVGLFITGCVVGVEYLSGGVCTKVVKPLWDSAVGVPTAQEATTAVDSVMLIEYSAPNAAKTALLKEVHGRLSSLEKKLTLDQVRVGALLDSRLDGLKDLLEEQRALLNNFQKVGNQFQLAYVQRIKSLITRSF